MKIIIHNKKMKITMFIGPMFSGKTSSLINEIEKNILAKYNCIIIKHSIDNRSPNNKLITHNGNTFSDCEILSYERLVDAIKIINKKNIKVVGIEEGQFFQKNDMLDFINSSNLNIDRLFISCLNGDFLKEPFDTVAALMPYSTIISLKAICYKCGKKALFSKRTSMSSSKILIGGSEKYKPSCINCYSI